MAAREQNGYPYRLLALVIGLVLNALGNALSVSANFGSGIWTAACVNIANWLHGDVGLILFIVGVGSATLNLFLIRHWDGWRWIGEVVFIASFSYFIDLFVALFKHWGVPDLATPWRILLSILGVTIFAISISIYQRANIVMHPNDDTSNILRFRYLHGRATLSQFVDFVPPIIMLIICVLGTHRLYSVNVATIYSMLFNGIIIAWTDEHILPSLHHNFRVKNHSAA